MPNLLKLKEIAKREFLSGLDEHCSVDDLDLVRQLAFSTVALLEDSVMARNDLSQAQLQRLIGLGLVTSAPPEKTRAVKEVAECIWRIADPSVLASDDSPSQRHLKAGAVVFHALVLDTTKEVLGEWWPNWRSVS
ncbi:hypothetical protein [Enhygromyxa salina]|uniref:hypothetical protein n=1 Tax=Enhygromyxa salina TaxID=215803 RepID=UPI0011B207BD|nr:hypothetical protein [Enhygromyxa salina]